MTTVLEHPRILRAADVCERTGLSKATMYRLIDRGEFPKQVKLSERCVGWSSAAVSDWIQQRLEEAEADEETA